MANYIQQNTGLLENYLLEIFYFKIYTIVYVFSSSYFLRTHNQSTLYENKKIMAYDVYASNQLLLHFTLVTSDLAIYFSSFKRSYHIRHLYINRFVKITNNKNHKCQIIRLLHIILIKINDKTKYFSYYAIPKLYLKHLNDCIYKYYAYYLFFK